jgi:GxxExxY protein
MSDQDHERDSQTSAVLAAAIEVHKTLGHGFLEAVYLNALCMEMKARGIPFIREVAIPVF